jgi:hypothetical protein
MRPEGCLVDEERGLEVAEYRRTWTVLAFAIIYFVWALVRYLKQHRTATSDEINFGGENWVCAHSGTTVKRKQLRSIAEY